MKRVLIRALAILLPSGLPVPASDGAAAALPVSIEAFFSKHCYECHDELSAEAGLDLTALVLDPAEPRSLAAWENVFARVESGEMPPPRKPRPDPVETKAFLGEVEGPLLESDRALLETEGRVHGRLLTRKQYETTLHDLLGIDIPLIDYLAADDGGHGFETVAEGQQLSHFHLQKFLAAADAALGEAFSRASRKDPEGGRTFRAKELIHGMDGNYRGPEARDGKTITWRHNLQFSGRMLKTAVPESGWYRITIENYRGINPGDDGAVWGSIRTGACSSDEPILTYVATVEALPDPRTSTFEAWIEKGHMIEFEPCEGTDPPAKDISRGGKIYYKKNRDLAAEGVAGIEFDSITMERFHPRATRQEVRESLYPGLRFAEGKPVVGDPGKELRRLVSNFAERAFRRPVPAAVSEPYVALAQESWERSKSFETALRDGYRAVLCSPRFLGFVEAPGLLDDYAVASRLSYFLWNTLPDSALLGLAARGELARPDNLAARVERMLADSRAERFVESFADQWLELKKIDFTTPDPRRFGAFDPALQDSMVEETRAFFAELLREDASVRNFILSDFAMWNSRLRSHYGSSEAELEAGKGIQRVSLAESIRGGLVTQGAILKVTADGSVTSPILRGVWVNERLLGLHTPPPPPNVPAIEPDIRGAKSIRDQLAKHSRDESCASCHAKIDPAGFALENFDPVGRWRTAYGSGKDAAMVDPSGTTPDGEPFAGIGQWKRIYAGRPAMLADAFARQLLTYAVGGEMRFSDRAAIDDIVASSAERDYGLRSLLQAAVASPVFLQK